MLVMGSKTLTVDGVTVYADHADPSQFWYLPAPVALAERNEVPQFTLIRYRPAVAGGGVQGGGFLMMEVELRLAPETESKIRSAVSRFSSGVPRLTAAPFDDGKVQIVALNIQGSGGTTATPAPPGSFVAVEAVLGASKPSLAGNNTAVFSLSLSQEGAIILDQAFRQGATPVGVIYDLKYTALRPALDVKITANFKRVYDKLNFSVDLTAGAVIYGVPVYLEAGLDMAFEKLKQEGVIDIQVTNFSSAADEADKEKWALDFFKQNLLQQWFQPTLAPVTFDRRPPAGGGTTPSTGGGTTPSTGGSTTPSTGGGTTPSTGGGTTPSTGGGTTPSTGGGTTPSTGGSATPAAGGSSSPAGTGAPASGGSSSSPGGTSPPAGSPAAPAGGSSAPATGAPSGGGTRPPGGGELPHESAVALRAQTREVWAYAFLESAERGPARLNRTVEPALPGFDVVLTQRADSDDVTLLFTGGDVPPLVMIDGQQEVLSDDRQVHLTLAAGASLPLLATYQPTAAAQQEFRLYFDFDKPRPQGWSNNPPSTAYSGYLANRTNPLDSRFETTAGPHGGSERGANALRAWLQSELGSPRRVTVESHASFEGDDATATLNQALSVRRADVAVGIIGSDAEVSSISPQGFSVARAANRVGSPEDRVAIIRGTSTSTSGVTIRGTLSRPAVQTRISHQQIPLRIRLATPRQIRPRTRLPTHQQIHHPIRLCVPPQIPLHLRRQARPHLPSRPSHPWA